MLVLRKLPLLAMAAALPLLVLPGCSRSPERRYASAMEKGKKLLAANDYSRAALEFQNATNAKPKDAEAFYLLAQAFLGGNQVRDAIVALRKASEANPEYAPAQVKLAELMVLTHNDQVTRQAEKRLQKVIADNPNDEDALFALAATESQLGRADDAEKYLNQIVEKSPRNMRSAVALAQVKFSQKDYDGAEDVLKKMVERLPNSPDAQVALGVVYAWRGKIAEARGALEKAIQSDPRNARALTVLGALQVRVGDLASAERTYRQVASLPQKENRLAYAVFLMQRNRQPEAVAELERLNKLDPGDRVARSGLVAGYLAANRLGEAETLLNAALQKNPRDTEALVQRSQIYLRADKLGEAQRDVETLLRNDATGQAHYLMSKIYRARGAVLQQKQELNEALRLAPELLRARLDLANVMLLHNSPKAAMDTLNGAQDRQKRTLAYVIALDWTLIALGDTTQARKGVDAVLAVSRAPDVLLQDAVLKLGAGNVAGARAVLEEILKANPEDVRALGSLVETYMAQKQPAAALEKIRQYAAMRPKSTALQMFLATWLLENNRESEGRQTVESLKAATPKDPIPELTLASLDMRANKLDDARRRLNALIAADPLNIDAQMMLGDIDEAVEHHTAAVEHYRKVLQVHSSNIRALNNLAVILSENTMQLDDALQYAQQAKELAPENSQIQDTLGWIYYQKGLYPMAVKELEAALARETRPAIQLHLGLTYKRMGNAEKGGRLVAAALAADPTLADRNILQ